MADKFRILLVDDEPDIIKILSRRLEFEGFDVSTAMDGAAALDKARSEKPNLILLDVMLPKLTGYEVCRQLKQDPRFQRIPIIMLTARVQDVDEETGFQMGTDVYIRKPFNTDQLLEKIRAFVPSAQ